MGGPAFTRPSTAIGPTIVPGVDFDIVCREIRCKWSPDDDKASLSAAQAVLNEYLPKLKEHGSVKRMVCGGCLDFKIQTMVPEGNFGDFESGGHGPEADIVGKLSGINGISQVETQTITWTEM